MHRAFNNTLLRLATLDDLTGFYNRRKIENLTQAEMRRAQMAHQPLAFLLLDADNFKSINDTYGHIAGDIALRSLADAIRRNLRPAEIVGRLGGDEFVVVLPNTTETAARQVALRLIAAVEKTPVYFEEKRVHLGISFEIAVFTTETSDFSQLVDCADQALYKMKRNRKIEFSGAG